MLNFYIVYELIKRSRVRMIRHKTASSILFSKLNRRFDIIDKSEIEDFSKARTAHPVQLIFLCS